MEIHCCKEWKRFVSTGSVADYLDYANYRNKFLEGTKEDVNCSCKTSSDMYICTSKFLYGQQSRNDG